MFNAYTSYNRWLDFYAKHLGGEPIVDPQGPFAIVATRQSVDPRPDPWRPLVAQLVQAAQVKEIASRLPEGRLKNALTQGANGSIQSAFDDEDICGTPPKGWPFPGPRPFVWAVVCELSFVANSFAAGGLREEILGIATQLAEKTGVEASG